MVRLQNECRKAQKYDRSDCLSAAILLIVKRTRGVHKYWQATDVLLWVWVWRAILYYHCH